MSRSQRSRVLVLALIVSACGDDEGSTPPGAIELTARFDGSVVSATATRPLAANEAVHLAVRRGHAGTQDCAQVVADAPAAITDAARTTLTGPTVDPALSKPFYNDQAWLTGPTPELLASLAGGVDVVIDLCLVRGGVVVAQSETDLFEAWDASTVGQPARQLHSARGYAEACVAELGDIPFFPPTVDGGHATFDCADGTLVPMSVTSEAGQTTFPGTAQPACDRPQYLDGGCEPGARVAARRNDQGTRWVLLCRKGDAALPPGHFNDIALIGHNPFSGKTCFFQNALFAKTDATKIPHPADAARSRELWSGVHGGQGQDSLACVSCHDADAWIHTPWIDGARDQNDALIVPKLGEDPDYAIGANDAPYSLVNADAQGWTVPRQIVSDEANACLQCHRIATGQWLTWLPRLDGTDPAFLARTTSAYRTFERIHWMPPELRGLDETTWPDSPYAAAIEFLKECALDPSLCVTEPIPTQTSTAPSGVLFDFALQPDEELATESLRLLGGTAGSEERCSDCHAVTRVGMRTWLTQTKDALAGCLAAQEPGEAQSVLLPTEALAAGQSRAYGPYTVGAGSTFTAQVNGTGDADLYVRRGAAASMTEHDCASQGDTAHEGCELPGLAEATQVYVTVVGFAASTYVFAASYADDSGAARSARTRVDCLRLVGGEPTSPFDPTKLGMFTTAAHLGWFQQLFRDAFPDDELAALEELARFKTKVGMPKGNHPRFTQVELNIVATWFMRGLPFMDELLADDPPPATCTPTVGDGLLAHVAEMATLGWAAQNVERNLRMYGCPDGALPIDCLADELTPADRAYAAGWETDAGSLRLLRELPFGTNYWTRSSADGRFVANGLANGASFGAMISDLARDVDIEVAAFYDPGFFPDNSGFMFQGQDATICSQALLESEPLEITLNEAQCRDPDNVGLYQHLGAAVEGTDYFAIFGQFVNDNGGYARERDPGAPFSSGARQTITTMVNDGSHFVDGQVVRVATPWEGDAILSPSTRLMVGRRAGVDGRQNGYVLRRLVATQNEAGVWSMSAEPVGELCRSGGKPSISFDERFMVFHHYVDEADFAEFGYADASDPEWQALVDAHASNIYLVDLTTLAVQRLTTMEGDQFALFPHFRSDGWIYFLVRDLARDKEIVVASDAALRLLTP